MTAPRPRVLVVDDNRDAADSLAMLLDLWGYEAIVAYDGREALEQVEAHGPQVVISDIHMPVMNGLDEARAIRALRRTPAPYLVALTSGGGLQGRRAAIAAGFDAFMDKPVAADTLEAVLRDAATMATTRSASFDLGELFALAARPVVAQTVSLGHTPHFDHQGPAAQVSGELDLFRRAMHRTMCAGLDVLEDGALMLSGRVRPIGDEVEFLLEATATGRLVDDAALDAVLHRLSLGPEGLDRQRSGRCPLTGGAQRFVREGSHGASFQWCYRGAGRVAHGPVPNAAGASALLVHENPGVAEGLGGRLRRMGWDVTLLNSPAEAIAMAQSDVFQPPSLVVVFQSPSASEQDVLDLIAASPEDAKVLFAVAAGSDAIGGRLGGDVVRVVPLLPSELWDLTMPHASSQGATTRPMPLGTDLPPRVLVVDDNEVNLIIAGGLLRMIGCETFTAASGPEAIAECASHRPALVLMDIDMPGMNGYEATHRIKDAQRAGEMAVFPVVALTAGGSARESQEHGLDAHLSKPVLIGQLRTVVERALKGVAP